MKIEKVEKYKVGDKEFATLEEARAYKGDDDLGLLSEATLEDYQEAVKTGVGKLAEAVTRTYSRIAKVRRAKAPAATSAGAS